MKYNLKQYTVSPDATIMDSLKTIDVNTKGFIIAVDEFEKVLGILTDGDIRRAFISGISVDDTVSKVMKTKFISLRKDASIADATEYFKSSAIKFIPILDDEDRLVNLITKQQMHSLLLLDIHADLMYEFERLDENIVDHEIFQRPWGFYKTTVMNDYFQSKIISVNPKSQLSLQSHNKREEHWIVAHGTGTMQIDDSIIPVVRGSSMFIPKGAKHRLINTDEKESLIITEVQIGNYFGEDDIIRYEDIYGRT
ncbi:CBS domain-containing protein [Eisenbergiella sp.]